MRTMPSESQDAILSPRMLKDTELTELLCP